MKAIVLAGGYAKRLWPLTREQAKPLVEVGGKPLISYIVEKLDKSRHIDEIIISTNAKFEGGFSKWLAAQKHSKPVRLVIEQSNREGEKLGAIGGIHYTIKSCKIDEDCLILYGDNLFDFDIDTFISHAKKKRTVVNAVFDVNDVEEAKKLGVVVLSGDKIVEFVEKPANPPSTLASVGCYLVPKESLHLYDKYLNEGHNKDTPGFFLQWLHKRLPVHAFIFDSAWFDIGTPENLEAARKFMEKHLTKN